MSMDQKSAGIAAGLKRLLKDSAGNVSIFLGIAAIPMFLGLGTAIDSIRASREQTAFQAALDAATIAVAADARSDFTGLDASQKESKRLLLQTMAQNYLNQNYVSGTGGISDVTVALTIDGRNINTAASHVFPTAIMGLVGINSMTMNLTSQTKRAQSGGVELTMVMDTTGSMDWNASGGTTNVVNDKRITGSRAAARTLLSIIYGGTAAAFPDNANIRLSFVPFAMAVNLDNAIPDFQAGWVDTAHLNPLSSLNKSKATMNNKDNYAAWNGNWTGCVEARAMSTGAAGTDYNLNDAAPVASNPATLFPAFYNADSNTPAATGCAATNIIPMTYKRATVEQGITDMQALGGTIIPEGLAWGWRTISPTEPFTQVAASPNQAAATIAPYHDTKWHKIMVLMTDGDNRVPADGNGNSLYYSSYGYPNMATGPNNRFGTSTTSATTANALIDSNLTALCNNVKAQGIELYVTGFGTSMTQATRNILRSCASAPASSHYSDAADNATLLSFFTQIGNNINENALYVSQ
jgi:Flp pilus assembly protein TadG